MTPAAHALVLDPVTSQMVDQTMMALASPGSYFTGEVRLAIARAARAKLSNVGAAPVLLRAIEQGIEWVANDAGLIDSGMVAAWEAAGLERLAYAELVSVVARVAAVDAYTTALGLPLMSFPTAVSGPTKPRIDERAELSNAWVPTVGTARTLNALSALPFERASTEAIHRVLYLNHELVPNCAEDPQREISRPQMELAAARASWLNGCFHSLLAHTSMLRESARAGGNEVEIAAVTNSVVESLVPDGRRILAFVDAAVLRDLDELPIARSDLLEAAGVGAVIRVAGVVANFEMMNRIIGGIGVPADSRYAEIAGELHLVSGDRAGSSPGS